METVEGVQQRHESRGGSKLDGGRSGGDDGRPVVDEARQQTLPLVVITFSHSVSPPSPGAISICPPESQTVSQLPTARVPPRTGEPSPPFLSLGGKLLEEGREDFLGGRGLVPTPTVLWPLDEPGRVGEMDKDCGGS